MNTNRIVIISGASCAGKDTIVNRWMALNPKIRKVTTCTTRPMRDGEVNGKSYFFYTIEQFRDMVSNSELLEYAIVHGNYYGTPKSEIARLTDEGNTVVLIVDVQGAKTIFEMWPDTQKNSVFIKAPDREELRRRLIARGTDDETSIITRLATAEVENQPQYTDLYSHVFVNNDADELVKTLVSLFPD